MASYLRLVWTIAGENIVIIVRKQLERLFGLKSKCVTNSLNHLKEAGLIDFTHAPFKPIVVSIVE